MELVQLLHEVVLGVQPARRVDEQVVGLARQCGGDGVVRHGGVRKAGIMPSAMDAPAMAVHATMYSAATPGEHQKPNAIGGMVDPQMRMAMDA